MAALTTLLSFLILFSTIQCLDAHKTQLSQGSSLSVEKAEDVLISPNKVFTAGFYEVGRNAFCFAIWFTNSVDLTVAWMVNRDQPVNGRYSELKLKNNGDIHLTDARRSMPVWSSNTIATSPVKLVLLDNGNLVLTNTLSKASIWQSFDFPTNTLLPNQLMTKDVSLISSMSPSNHSSGFYKFFFDNDNVLRLFFDGPEISSVYWPTPLQTTWQNERTTYNDSRVALYDSSGLFSSSDEMGFYAADFGVGPQRRLTLDFDGNLRLYSMQQNGEWEVTWLAIKQQCSVHGLCGPYALCEYLPNFGRKCRCLPGFKPRSSTSWVLGCEPEFNFKEDLQEMKFVTFSNTEFYGYDIYYYFSDYTIEMCEDFCRKLKYCKGFLLKPSKNVYNCFPKRLLLNGYHSPSFTGTLYMKVPRNYSNSLQIFEEQLNCEGFKKEVVLNRSYGAGQNGGLLKFLLVFVSSLGVVELLCIFLVWCFLFRAYEDPSVALQGYVLAHTGFKRYSYADLRKATYNFRQEIGRGGSGIVYKGAHPDGKLIAVKKLNDEGQGEAEFLAEVNTIGRLKHMNLIELLGYCLEGKKRLLVFEFMENRSLAENLSSNSLNWEKRFEIALGTAKGLAYLHEECLEWVLHCDVKPQNILLDSEYQPRVADFGLSKLVKRDGSQDSNFSRIRGTRGYMAPEWVSNWLITSKVDVYSYGVVMLEIVTGKNPSEMEQQGLVKWVKKKMNGTETLESWIEEISDPALEGSYDIEGMKTLALVALQCVEEDRDARPTMSQVADLLQNYIEICQVVVGNKN